MQNMIFYKEKRLVFYQHALFRRFEKLVEASREKVSHRGVTDIFTLLSKGLKVQVRDVPRVLTGMVPLWKNYKVHMVTTFDKYHDERHRWGLELDSLSGQYGQLDTAPWSTASPRSMREREAEMAALRASITLVKSKLEGLPAQNTFLPEELYYNESNEEMEKKGFITNLDAPYPHLSELGTKFYMTARELLYYVDGQVRSGAVNDEEKFKALQEEIWPQMKAAYDG